jgi:hypothetical protein
MQAIFTRYVAPGNVRGSRIKARAWDKSITLEWDDGLNSDENHIAAARALADKMNWAAEWVMGGMRDGSCVFVGVDKFKSGFRSGAKA